MATGYLRNHLHVARCAATFDWFIDHAIARQILPPPWKSDETCQEDRESVLAINFRFHHRCRFRTNRSGQHGGVSWMVKDSPIKPPPINHGCFAGLFRSFTNSPH